MPRSHAAAFASLLCGLAMTPAQAFDANKLGQGGSLPLDDLAPLIGQSAQLQREVSEALAAAKQKAADIVCTGNRFPRQWTNFGGRRVAPYTCDFGGKWLVIDATVRVTGKGGQVYDTITPAAMKNATKVVETKPTWKWTTDDPSDEKK